MSNKLKTLSKIQLETFIAEKAGAYPDEDYTCEVSGLSTPGSPDRLLVLTVKQILLYMM